MNFRLDVNGLRAFAVLAVVLFHFGIDGFGAGFLGVDVFFVISGFLMTDIIKRSLEESRFNLLQFFLSRARRIIPALAFLCIFLLVFGYFVLIPDDYEQLGKHVGASIGFISNGVYLDEAGYFDALSHEKLLLHTWSLSVEWQFYLLFPVIVLLLSRFGLNAIRNALIVISVASFGYALHLQSISSDLAYYRFSARIWEMTLGGLVVLFPLSTKKFGSAFYFSGLSLLVLSMIVVDENTPWPGAKTLLPISATILFLYANRSNSFLLGNVIVQWIGSRSYSIYLWHWPIVAALVLAGLSNSLTFQVAGIALSLLMGHFSYLFIEQKLSGIRLLNLPRYKGLAVFIGIFVFVWSCGRVVLVNDGFHERMPKDKVDHLLVMPTRKNGWCFNDYDKKDNRLPSKEEAVCTLVESEEGEKRGLLIGDSFAGHFEPLWKTVATERNIGMDVMTTNWCYPSTNENFIGLKSHTSYQQCLINRKMMPSLFTQYDFIVIGGHWKKIGKASLMGDINNFAEEVLKRERPIIIMASPTIFDVNVLKRYRFSKLNNIEFDITSVPQAGDRQISKLNSDLKQFSDQNNGVYFIERKDLFNNKGMYSEVSEDNIPLSLDGRHLSIYGSLNAAASFLKSKKFEELKESDIF